jgi:beta-glucosidase
MRELTLQSTVQEWFEHPVVGTVLLDTLQSDLLRAIARPESLRMLGSLPMQKVVNLLGDTVAGDDVEKLMAATRGTHAKRDSRAGEHVRPRRAVQLSH